ncbi:MAG: hypothetical protein ACTHKK_04840 [Candidatus Nitrosocosmicus sp.]
MTNTNDNTSDREYEEDSAGTNPNRKSNPLKEYEDKEAMTPAKINAGEPTAVKRDQTDQMITEQGQTGTESQQANEEYRKRGSGMTKIDDESK